MDNYKDENGNRVSLKEFILHKLADMDGKAEVLAELMEKRLDGMNEFRATLKDQSEKFITRAEHDVLAEKIQDLMEYRAELKGKASQTSAMISLIIAVLGLLLSVSSIMIMLSRT